MKTSNVYKNNLKKGIITNEMLRDCLYSVNKRAKNARDKEREYMKKRRENRFFIDKYDNEEKYYQKKLAHYAQKEQLLRIAEPDCIHVEQQKKKKRICEGEADFDCYQKEDIIYTNAYYDEMTDKMVRFIDVEVTVDKYYLFYDFGNCSFHTPIDNPGLYKHLEQKEIGTLTTYGHAIEDLQSMQFVRKVLDLIDSGEYTYVS